MYKWVIVVHHQYNHQTNQGHPQEFLKDLYCPLHVIQAGNHLSIQSSPKCLGGVIIVIMLLHIKRSVRAANQSTNIRQDTSAIWEKLIEPACRAHLFDEVSAPLIISIRYTGCLRRFQSRYTCTGCFIPHIPTICSERNSRDCVGG